MANLSNKLSSLQFTPKAQSPLKAGAIFQVASDDVTAWEQLNWFKCDGSEYAEADYAQLFSVLGSKYNTGGETASHFRVPNGPYKTIDSIDTDLTSTPTGWSLVAENNSVWCNTLGEWWCTLHFSANTSVLTADGLIITIAGLTFASGSQIGAADEGSPGQVPFTVSAGGSSLTLNAETGQQMNGWNSSGTFKLASKPTDAFVGADARFSTFDEALESQPMIKVYDDASNISMSIADATASLTGSVRLSADFAAGDGVYGFVELEKYQQKNIASDVTTTTNDFDNFNSLVIGKRYRIQINMHVVLTTAGTAHAFVDIVHDSVNLDRIVLADSNNNVEQSTKSTVVEFTATTTKVQLDAIILNSSIIGDGTPTQSNWKIWQVNTVVTTDFT